MKKNKKKSRVIPTWVIIIADILLIIILAIWLLVFMKKPLAGTDPARITADAMSAVAKCRDVPNWRDCYGYKIAEYLKKDSLDYSMKVLDKVEDIDEKAQSCHVIAHRMAAAEMEKDPSKWGDLVKKVDQNFCSYGFIHGVIEARSRFEPEFAVNPKSIEQICDLISGGTRVRGTDQSCAHIMGHVVLAEKEGSVPQAIAVCDKIEEKLQYQCNSGIFMENFTRDNLVAHGIAEYAPWGEETIQSQEELCLSHEDSISAKACWMEVSHLYANKYPFQPEKVYKECQKAPSELFREECYMHSIQTLLEKPNPTDAYLLSLCEPFRTRGRYYECEGVIVHSYINSSLKLTSKAFEYCAMVPGEFKSYCFQKIGKILEMHLPKKEVTAYCRSAPSNYQHDCNNPSDRI